MFLADSLLAWRYYKVWVENCFIRYYSNFFNIFHCQAFGVLYNQMFKAPYKNSSNDCMKNENNPLRHCIPAILNSSGENGHLCLIPDLRGKMFSFAPLSMMLVVGLYTVLMMLW